MPKRIFTLLILLLMLLSLTACGNTNAPAISVIDDSSEEPAVSVEPEPEPEPEGPSGTDPLTGQPMEEEQAAKRPIAVMLNDLKAAQPQLGVSHADIIYEVPAEGGITRMLGVFQTLDGVGDLGSIRSTRPYYIELALGHDALLVHAGGSPDAYSDIASWDVDNMDGVNGGSDANIFWRDPQRKKKAGYEHSLLTSGENVTGYVNAGHFRTDHNSGYTYPQTFAEDGTPVNGTAAEQVSVKFSYYKTAAFTYDAATKRYLVSQYGSAYIDGDTGEQVGVTNVLVLNTSIYAISGDTSGRLSVKLTGSGSGTYFCGGKSIPIQWSKASRNDPLVYTLESGEPLVMGQGPSYVCIISPKSSTVTVS